MSDESHIYITITCSEEETAKDAAKALRKALKDNDHELTTATIAILTIHS